MRLRHLLALAALLSVGCVDEGVTLAVDLATDLVPGVEVTRAEIRLYRGGVPGADASAERTTTATLARGDDLRDGTRVAELDGLEKGDWALRVTLLDAEGAEVLERVALVHLETTTSVTLLMARSCRGVMCPAAGGDPAAIACLGGRCVRPECTPETPDLCPPASCADAAGCPAPVASCADAECFRGECFAVGVDARCGDGVCLPDEGCQGGPLDAGVPDAAVPPGATGATASVRAIGSAGDEEGYDLAVHPATGTLVVVGQFQQTLDFGAWTVSSNGGSDHFIAAYAADGTNLWARGAGGAASSEDRASGVAVDASGNVYVSGHFTGSADFGGGVRPSAGSWDGFVASYDALGEHRWDVTIGGVDGDLAYDVAVSPDGSVWATGYYAGAIDLGGGALPAAGGNELFVVRLDGATGAHLGSAGFATAGTDQSHCVTVDASGNGIVGFESGGDVMVAGQTITGLGVVAFDPDVAPIWARSIGAGTAWGVEAVDGDEVVMTGYLTGASDFGGGSVTPAGAWSAYVVRYGPGGTYRWARVFDGSENGLGLGITTDAAGRTYVVGMAGVDVDFGTGLVTGAGGQDVFVAALDPDGATRWAHLYGSAGQDRGHGIAAHPDGRVFATGRFADGAVFGDGTPRTVVGGDDFFLLELE